MPRTPRDDADRERDSARRRERDSARRRERPEGGRPEQSKGRAGSRPTGHAVPADRQARRDSRRLELLAAAVEVIRRDGPGASMDQMAAAAGITKPILYRYFGDRTGLVDAISAYSLSLLSAAIGEVLRSDAAPREIVSSAIDAYLRFVESEPEVYRFLVQRAVPEGRAAAAVGDFVSQISRRIAVVLGEGLRVGGADSAPAEVWAYAMVGMVHAAGDWWLERRSLPRSRMTAYLTTLVCDGLPEIDGLGPASTWLQPDVVADPSRLDLVPVSPEAIAGGTAGAFDLLGSARSVPPRRGQAGRAGSSSASGAGPRRRGGSTRSERPS